ncbi:MAG: PocR ligand-binding domain-containing protein [Desulfovibrionaceae bacterium]|nr:PocR ligand-binding domain-containing protein [Desulfovibrionaceae bacterium]
MHLTDYISAEDLRALQEELSERYGLNADIMDADGKRLFGTTWGNDLCMAIRDDDKGFGSICVPAGQMFAHLMKQGKPFTEECDAGMMRVSVPVVVDGMVIGAVGGCGLVSFEGEADPFAIGMMSDMDESTAADMAKKLEPAPDGRTEMIQAYIRKRIEELRK